MKRIVIIITATLAIIGICAAVHAAVPTSNQLLYYTPAGTFAGTSSPTVGFINATSTTATSIFPNASTTNLFTNTLGVNLGTTPPAYNIDTYGTFGDSKSVTHPWFISDIIGFFYFPSFTAFFGNISNTGYYADSSASPGSNGYVLTSAGGGTQTKWVATSSLGITGGTNYFTYSSPTTTLTTGTVLQATTGNFGSVNATSSATSYFTSPISADGGITTQNGTLNVNDSQLSLTGSNPQTLAFGLGESTITQLAGTNLVIAPATGGIVALHGNGGSIMLGSASDIISTGNNASTTFNGPVYLLKGVYDHSSSLGTNGQVLQTSGTNASWVSTSSLNITGGTNYWSQSGATTTNTVANVASTLGVFGTIAATSTATSTFAGTISVASTTGTSTFAGSLVVGGGSNQSPAQLVISNPIERGNGGGTTLPPYFTLWSEGNLNGGTVDQLYNGALFSVDNNSDYGAYIAAERNSGGTVLTQLGVRVGAVNHSSIILSPSGPPTFPSGLAAPVYINDTSASGGESNIVMFGGGAGNQLNTGVNNGIDLGLDPNPDYGNYIHTLYPTYAGSLNSGLGILGARWNAANTNTLFWWAGGVGINTDPTKGFASSTLNVNGNASIGNEMSNVAPTNGLHVTGAVSIATTSSTGILNLGDDSSSASTTIIMSGKMQYQYNDPVLGLSCAEAVSRTWIFIAGACTP